MMTIVDYTDAGTFPNDGQNVRYETSLGIKCEGIYDADNECVGTDDIFYIERWEPIM